MDKSLDRKKVAQSLEAARLYYVSEIGQTEIAETMQLSRPTVSRLLQYAKNHGLVKIEIIDPFENMEELGNLIAERYNVPEVHVIFAPDNDYQRLVNELGKFTAAYLGKIVTNNDVIGVSWGLTLQAVANHLTKHEVLGVEVVQLKGSITYSTTKNYANEVLDSFSAAFNTAPQTLPLPVIFENAQTRDLVMQDRHIHRIIDLGKHCNIAVTTVGTTRDDALLFKLGYFNKTEITYLKNHAVGDICSRFFDKDGNIADSKINERTVGIELDDLRHKEKSILVAGGEHKTKAIRSALIGGYTNCLITDQSTAKRLLAK